MIYLGSFKSQYELDCASVLHHLSSDFNVHIVEHFEYLWLLGPIFEDYHSLLLLRLRLDHDFVSNSWVKSQKAFETKLLDHDIGATLGNPHHTGTLFALRTLAAHERLEVEVSVELDTGLGGQLSHPVLAIHLVALLGHLELVSHIIGKTLDVNRGSQQSVDQHICVTTDGRCEMRVLCHR